MRTRGGEILRFSLCRDVGAVVAWGMGFDATARRRWLGALALVAALGMVLAGETVLKGRLQAPALLVYFLLCLSLTALAMSAALLDLRALRRQSRDKQRDLFQETLKSIEKDAKSRSGRRAASGKGS
jgi:hypothetical protein